MQCIQKLNEHANPRVQILGRASSWFSFFLVIYHLSQNINTTYLSIIYFFPQYHQLTVSDDYFENKIAMNKMLVQKNFGMLRHPVNKDM